MKARKGLQETTPRVVQGRLGLEEEEEKKRAKRIRLPEQEDTRHF